MNAISAAPDHDDDFATELIGDAAQFRFVSDERAILFRTARDISGPH